jgi:hypothetical protein
MHVNAASLPSGSDHALAGGFEALMSIGDDEPDAFQPALDQGFQEAGPEGFGL